MNCVYSCLILQPQAAFNCSSKLLVFPLISVVCADFCYYWASHGLNWLCALSSHWAITVLGQLAEPQIAPNAVQLMCLCM